MKAASKWYWLAQFIGWGLFCMLIAVTQIILGEFTPETLRQLISIFMLAVIISHGVRFFLLKFNWINLKFAPLIPRVLILNYIASVVLVASIFGVSSLFGEVKNEEPSVGELFINTWVYMLFLLLWTAIYLTYHLLQKSRNQELLNLKLESSQHEIELKTLREQLNPHFLFNSLNSIRALVAVDPDTAKKAITTLSSLLRSSLQMGKKTQVSLKDEIQLVKEYLALEKIRFEERLEVSYKITANNSLLIPPFIIQTLAENAIKHGISKKAKGGKVIIEVDASGSQISIKVSNSGKLSTAYKEGIGLSNSKRRLELQYGNKAQLSLLQKEDVVVATIKLPASLNKEHKKKN